MPGQPRCIALKSFEHGVAALQAIHERAGPFQGRCQLSCHRHVAITPQLLELGRELGAQPREYLPDPVRDHLTLASKLLVDSEGLPIRVVVHSAAIQDRDGAELSWTVVLRRRWIVERTFSWFGRNRRLATDLENLASTLETFVTLGSIQLALRLPARA